MDLLLICRIIKRMVLSIIHTVDAGLTEKNKVKAQKYGMMELSLKEIMKMIRNMVRVLYS